MSAVARPAPARLLRRRPGTARTSPGAPRPRPRHTARNLAAAGVEVTVLTTCLGGLGADWDRDGSRAARAARRACGCCASPPRRATAAGSTGSTPRAMAGDVAERRGGARLLRQHGAQPGAAQAPGRAPERGPSSSSPISSPPPCSGPLVHPARSVLDPLPARRGLRPDEGGPAGLRERAGRRLPRPGRARPGRLALRPLAAATAWSSARASTPAGAPTPARFRRTHGLDGPFILYAGRKDAGKNTPLLLQYFLRYRPTAAARAASSWCSSAPARRHPRRRGARR